MWVGSESSDMDWAQFSHSQTKLKKAKAIVFGSSDFICLKLFDSLRIPKLTINNAGEKICALVDEIFNLGIVLDSTLL